MFSRNLIITTAAVSSLLIASPVFSDATFYMKGSNGDDSTVQTKNGVAIMKEAGDSDYMVYNKETKTMAHVDVTRGRYMPMTEQQMENNMKSAGDAQRQMAPDIAKMRAGLDKIPASQRKFIEDKLNAMSRGPAAGQPATPANIRTVNIGTQTIAGLKCEAKEVVKNDKPVGKVCMMTSANGNVSQEDFETLSELFAFTRSMAAKSSKMAGGAAGQSAFLAVDLKGLPISMKDDEEGEQFTLISVSDEELPEELFTDYKKLKKEEMPKM